MVSARSLSLFAFALLVSFGSLALADEPKLTLDIGGTQKNLTRAQLLGDPAVVAIDVPDDNAYGRTMHYRAVPLDRLLAGFALPGDQVLEAVASDGFVGLLPADLVFHPSAGGGRA